MSLRIIRIVSLVFFLGVLLSPTLSVAQESPLFVTYNHYLEEPGTLEIGVAATTGLPRHDQSAYGAPWLELEYGVTGWWTTELYLEGVMTSRDGSGFAGWRWEHRFRPLKSEHRVNPVFYLEYERISEASRIQKEIVGSGSLPFEPIADLRREVAHEIEGKLILSSTAGPWNISENFIVEKNLTEDEGFEFGYTVGVARSLGNLARGTSCRFCRENFVVGAEMYGGLGSTNAFGTDDTRHFIAPGVSWRVADAVTLKASLAFGLTSASDRYLLRVGWAYELPMRGRRQ